MPDVVVTLPVAFRWGGLRTAIVSWFAEGAAPGQAAAGGTLYSWAVSGRPDIADGERVYVAHRGRLIGYAPLVFVQPHVIGRGCDLVRGGGAVACTIDQPIPGFRGFRYRWWPRSDEKAIDLVEAFPELASLPAFQKESARA